MKAQHYQLIARVGYYALLLLIPLWNLCLAPPSLGISPWLITVIWFIPLTLPLRGIIDGNAYTFAWSGFIALLYMMHALVVIYNAYLECITLEIVLGTVELLLASLFFIGSVYVAKYRGQELGLSIRNKRAK